MTTELVLLGTAGGPMPAAGRAGISSAVVVDGHVYLVDCGRGSPSGYVDAGLKFPALTAVFLTHLHFDHVGDLPGLLIYPWGSRTSDGAPLAPVEIYGPARSVTLPEGDESLHRETIVAPKNPAPGTEDLVRGILDTFAYHLNVMPLDATMPDAGMLAVGVDIDFVDPDQIATVFEDDRVSVTAVQVSHGRARPALAYRFETADGSIVFSGDTARDDRLIRLAAGADVLVHEVADLAWLEHHGTTGHALERMTALHTDTTEVGPVAQLADVRTLVLNHYLPADTSAISRDEWSTRSRGGFSGDVIAAHDGLHIPLPRS